MRAGALDRRVTLRQNVVTQSTSGGAQSTWSDVATVWAQVRALRGREFLAARQVAAEVDTRFRIRWRSDVRPTWRIAHDGRDYDIVQVIEMGRREGLEIMATARAE